jgi:hypothetical protein
VSWLLLLLLLQESDILFFYAQVHKLQPGFFIAVDHKQHKLLWVIRGAYSILNSFQTAIAVVLCQAAARQLKR